MDQPIFIVGAGFNADAVHQAGPIYGNSYYIGCHQIRCGYPLVGSLADLCFGLKAPPTDKSIEQLFQEAADRHDREPLRRLADELSKAYFLSHALIFKKRDNRYSDFFNRFHRSDFINFNYDALVELFLMSHKVWFPKDGYGVQAEVGVVSKHEDWLEQRSSLLVLHLHGSLCLFTALTNVHRGNPYPELRPRETPLYQFHPHSLEHCFTPFKKPASMTMGLESPEERIIAPVPSKATGLVQEFIKAGFARARQLLAATKSPVTAIGYSFNEHDRESYETLLASLGASANPTLVLVSPNAKEIRDRLASQYTGIDIIPERYTFSNWVAEGCPSAP